MSTPHTTGAKLPSLSEWSIQRIKKIFESTTDEESLRSIRATFKDNVTATINGAPLSRDGIAQLVLAMRRSSKTGLSVIWHHTVEVARDPSTNRVRFFWSCRPSRRGPSDLTFLSRQDGSFGGYYIIRGLRKQLPGMYHPVDFERHKTVTVTYVEFSIVFQPWTRCFPKRMN